MGKMKSLRIVCLQVFNWNLVLVHHNLFFQLGKLFGVLIAALAGWLGWFRDGSRSSCNNNFWCRAELRLSEHWSCCLFTGAHSHMVGLRPNAELQVAMSKAKADADRKEAEEEAKAAAELAAEAATKAMAEAEMYQRALASYLASDASPAAKAAKKAMESTHCASPSLDPPRRPPPLTRGTSAETPAQHPLSSPFSGRQSCDARGAVHMEPVAAPAAVPARCLLRCWSCCIPTVPHVSFVEQGHASRCARTGHVAPWIPSRSPCASSWRMP